MIDSDESKKESFFTIDSETLGLSDKSIVMNTSINFVDMEKIYNASSTKGELLTFDEFIEHIDVLDIFFSVKEQRELGRESVDGTVSFWKEQYANAPTDYYKKYILFMLGALDEFDGNKIVSVAEGVQLIENFVGERIDNLKREGYTNDIPFLERGGGFDTGKYYSLLRETGQSNVNSNIKHWSRREIRSILSSNRYRIPESFLKDGTTYSQSLLDTLCKDSDKYIKHIAKFDALLDSYVLHILKLTIDDFYI